MASEPTTQDRALRRSLLGQALYDTFGQAGAKFGAIWIGIVALLSVLAPFIANSHPIVMRAKGGELTSPLLSSLTAVDVSLVLLFGYVVWVFIRRPAAPRAVALLVWPLLIAVTVVLVARYGEMLIKFRTYQPGWLGGLDGFASLLGWAWVILLNGLSLLAGLAGLALVSVATRNFFLAMRDSVRDVAGAVVVAVLMIVAAFAVNPPLNPVYERFREMERAGQLEMVVRTVIPFSPNDRLRDQRDVTLRPPTRTHWLGTTLFSEDLLSRMLHACRVALAIGVIATGIATVIGIAVGGIMGYYSGTIDLLGMRVLEIIEAIPTLILLLIVTVFFGRSLYLMMVVIGLVTWTSDARFIRAEFLKLRNLDFVHAAVATGLRRSSIIFRHMLPNGVAPVLVNASFGIAGAILLESTLSFLGLGLGPDDPSWGQLLNQARAGGRGFSWWIATFPGAAIFLTVFAYILIGEALRDAIDPRLRKRD
jgi:peptide/nickel transport system permease protein